MIGELIITFHSTYLKVDFYHQICHNSANAEYFAVQLLIPSIVGIGKATCSLLHTQHFNLE